MSIATCPGEPSRTVPHGARCRRYNRKRGNRRTVTMPERVGPHVKLVFAEMARLMVTYDETEEGSGVRRASIKAWRKKNRPGLESIEAVLGWLGWDFTPTPAIKVLPPHIAADLAAFAAKLQTDLPNTWAALIDIGVERKLRRMSAAERGAALEDCMARQSAPPLAREKSAPTLQ